MLIVSCDEGMAKPQHYEARFRKHKSNVGSVKPGCESDFLLNIQDFDDSLIPRDVFFIRLSSAISSLFGISLLCFLLSDNCYLVISQFVFLLVSIFHCVLEIAKYSVYSFKTRQKFPSVTYENARNFFFSYVILVACSYVLSILFGADFIENVAATFIFSCHSSMFVFVPFYFHVKNRYLRILIAEEKTRTPIECCCLIVAVSVIVGAWTGAFVVPLDWDRDWQTWPIPNILGTLFGFTASNIFLFSCSFLKPARFQRIISILKVEKTPG